MSDLQLRRTRTYQEAFRPLGIDRQFSMLTARPGPTGMPAWALVRNRQDFNDSALETARQVQTMLCVLDRAQRVSRGTSSARGEHYSLTARVQEIMQLLGRGLTAGAIGHLLGVSPRTVAKHVEHTYAKLRCTNRIDAVRILRGQ